MTGPADLLSQVAFQVARKTPGFNEWRERSFNASGVALVCGSRFFSGELHAQFSNSITVDRTRRQITANIVGPLGCEREVSFQADDLDYIQEFRLIPLPVWEPGDISGTFNFELTSSSF